MSLGLGKSLYIKRTKVRRTYDTAQFIGTYSMSLRWIDKIGVVRLGIARPNAQLGRSSWIVWLMYVNDVTTTLSTAPINDC